MHPWWMLTFLVLTAVTFSLFGFIIGIWADGFEKLQMIPMLVVTPLTFLGGSFYSVNMLPSGWRTITLLNPVVYLISGFRWSFYEIADVSVALSIGMTVGFLVICMAIGVVDLQDRVSAEELTYAIAPEVAAAVVIAAATVAAAPAAIGNAKHALTAPVAPAPPTGPPIRLPLVGALLGPAHDTLGLAEMAARRALDARHLLAKKSAPRCRSRRVPPCLRRAAH